MKVLKPRNEMKALKSGRYDLGTFLDQKKMEKAVDRFQDMVDSEGWSLFDDVEYFAVDDTLGFTVVGCKM